MKERLLPILISTVLATLPLASARAADPYRSQLSAISVDLRDLVAQAPKLLPEAIPVLASLRKDPKAYGLQPDARIFGVEATSAASSVEGGSRLPLLLLVSDKKLGRVFRKVEVTVAGQPAAVTAIKVLQDIPLAQTHFTVRTGLLQRKTIVEDREHGIRKIYPIDVGGIDMGVTPASRGRNGVMTPLFARATIGRGTAIAARTFPEYFKGLPFIPLTRADGTRTPIAFHIIQRPQMLRGFDSHGCMRLREKDLTELHAIVAYGGSVTIPVDVMLELDESDDHPHARRDDGYVRVRDCAAPGKKPRSCRDENGLTIITDGPGRPPFERLEGFNGDDMTPAELARFEQGQSTPRSPGTPAQGPNPPQLPPQMIDELLGTQRGA